MFERELYTKTTYSNLSQLGERVYESGAAYKCANHRITPGMGDQHSKET
jgi:hypothetical protein